MYDDLVKRLREHNGWALNETLDQAAEGGMSMNTCADCYWYSDITFHVCELEKEPTSADQEACPMFEQKEE